MKAHFFKSPYRVALLLLLVCVVAYLPLASFRFALKNDAFLYNFPNKLFFSDALHAGVWPLWNPYLNYGFPLYADPGFAWWQPITWLFGFIGYNPYTFTIEVLLYIYIGGVGMYWLGRVLGQEPLTAFAMGTLFMCSGFFTGNLQHINFLTCVAFLPWLTGAWLRYQQNASVKNRLCCGAACYLLCTGGHPAIPIATLYFFGLLTVGYFLAHRTETFSKAHIITQLKLLLCCVLFLLPLLFSYAQLWPLYNRALPDAQASSLNTGFTLPAYLSFALPLATIKNAAFFATDVSMRNAYFSLGGLVLLLQVLVQRKQPYQLYFLSAGAGLLLLAAGGVLKSILYQTLPLLSFIRTNGEFRVFAIFSFIVCVAAPLNALVQQHKEAVAQTKKWFLITAVLLALLCITLFVFIDKKLPVNSAGLSLTARVKAVLDNLTFEQSLFIAAVIALVFALFYRYALQKKSARFFVAALIADVVVNSWLLLPVTGVSQHSVAEMQAIINRRPKGFPVPPLHDISFVKPVTPAEESLIGNWNWYAKQIVYRDAIVYPSVLKITEAFLQSPDTSFVRNQPFLFLKNGSGTLRITRFAPGRVDVETTLRAADTLVLLQNRYPGWRAWAFEKVVTLQPYRHTFMQLPVGETTKHVSFRFSLF